MQIGKLWGYRKEIGKRSVYTIPGIAENAPDKQYLFSSKSPTMGQIFNTVARLLNTNTPLLLTGEPGVGKEAFARAIHRTGGQRSGEFIKIDCGAIDARCFWQAIFQPAKTAVDALLTNGRQHLTKPVLAGTIFLKNIEHLALELQASVLDMLKEKAVGHPETRQKFILDVRFIAAARRDLWSGVENRAFRKDLYYRLSIYPLLLPPLRERAADIGDLASHFCRLYAGHQKKNLPVLTKDAIANLKLHTWPGNIRELHQVVLHTLEASNGQERISNIKWLSQPCCAQKSGFVNPAAHNSETEPENDKEASRHANFSTLTS